MELFEGVELSDEQKAALQANIDKKFEGYQSPEDVAGLKKSRDDLLAEKKQASEAALAAEEKAKEEALKAAKKDGDISALEKSYQEKLKAYEDKEKQREESVKTERINSKAIEMASELADGPNVKLLSTFIKSRLDFRENELKVLDKDGQLTVSSIDELKLEFKNNSDFASLITASKASGGGANGSKSSGATSKTLKDIPVTDSKARKAAIAERLNNRGD